MTGSGQFDPFNQARLPAPPLEGKGEERYSVKLIMFSEWKNDDDVNIFFFK